MMFMMVIIINKIFSFIRRSKVQFYPEPMVRLSNANDQLKEDEEEVDDSSRGSLSSPGAKL